VVARLTAATRSGLVGTAVVVLAFGVAFGYLEATVVVYLRAALGVIPGAVMAHDPATLGTFEVVEIARELATLVMIATVGWIAGQARLERLAWAAVVFGTWDITYYAGLRLVIGWPPSLDTLDVLFLVPGPWVGPVWAPLLVSLALVVAGLAAARRLHAGATVRLGATRIVAALAGGLLVILSFLLEPNPDPSGAWTAWPVFWLGMALAIVAAISALAGPWVTSPPCRPFLPGSARRPPVGTPD
jgi:hypothetical protein